MSEQVLVLSAENSPLADSWNDVSASEEELLRLVQQWLDRCEAWDASLARRQKSWLLEREEEAARLAEQTRRLEADRRQLAAEREELTRRHHAERQEIDERWNALQPPPQAAIGPDTSERLAALEQSRDQLVEERAVLEAELETVRRRAAEAADALAAERQQRVAEHEEWSGQFRAIRQLLETLLAAGAVAARAAPEEVPPARPSARSGGRDAAADNGDPVLASVVAQFEMLQSDMMRRRKAHGA